MAYLNLFLFLSIISLYHLIKYASSLSIEGVANGINAPQINFTYQAAIIGRKHKDAVIELFGNGALVSHNWLLCAAQSFMEDTDLLRDYIFTAVLGYNYLPDRNDKSELLIVEIRTQRYYADANQNNIAMAKLEKSINDIVPRLRAHHVQKPSRDDSFIDRTGVVSGFGDSDTERSNLVLHYINIKVTHASECVQDFPATYIHEDKHFCGLSLNVTTTLNTGVCSNDIGGPLVIDEKIAGLVTSTHENCDDRTLGALYTNVPAHYDLVDSCINDGHIHGVDVYPTRIA